MYAKARQKVTKYFQKRSVASSNDLARKSVKRHQLKLRIPRPLPQIQINGTGEPTRTKAQTTTTEYPPTLRRRMRGEQTDTPLVEKNDSGEEHGERNGEPKRNAIHLQRGISEERRSSLSHTPRAFKLRQLTLNYDRSKMKAPLQTSEGATPNTPMMDTLEQRSPGSSQSPDSYHPRIVSSTWNWSALLARNYSTLTNLKLLVTIVINFLLLTYKVVSVGGVCARRKSCVHLFVMFD